MMKNKPLIITITDHENAYKAVAESGCYTSTVIDENRLKACSLALAKVRNIINLNHNPNLLNEAKELGKRAAEIGIDELDILNKVSSGYYESYSESQQQDALSIAEAEIPDWANWRAVDSDGEIYVYKFKPLLSENAWTDPEHNSEMYIATTKNSGSISAWKDSLIKLEN